MILKRLKTGTPLLLFWLLIGSALIAQCPTLNSTATLVSSQCAPGYSPCHLCPGQQMTLTATGTGLPGGGCINWYYGTTNNFNPYNGQGTLLGCSPIPGAPPPAPCNQCPLTLGLFVDACGTEQDNEFMFLWSGSGFEVNSMTIDLPPGNNVNLPNDDDLGSSNCPFMMPTPGAIASVQTFCPSATVIGVGPGQSVPPNVPVLIFMSSNLSFGYNWGSLCPLSPTIYVMQNSCPRQTGAFSNKSSAPGTRTITTSLSCGCTDVSTYNLSLLTNGANGDFFIDANLNFPPLQYGNAGCGFPPLPPGIVPPPPPPPGPPTSYVATITPDMCNGGPYWVVGVVDPLNSSCPPVFTNYLPFNVVCPNPNLGTAQLCSNSGLFNLTTLADPAWPNGTWSGPGVAGNTFNPAGQSGVVTVNFTPSTPCTQAFPTTIEVSAAPSANFSALPPVCPGQPFDLLIYFNGAPPFSFNLTANGNLLQSVTTFDNPFTFQHAITVNTTFRVENLQSGSGCSGANAQLQVTVAQPPSAHLTLVGGGAICSGQSTQLGIDFSGGTPPWTFVVSANGVAGNPQTTFNDPYIFTVTPTTSTHYVLEFVEAGGCTGNASGSTYVVVAAPASGQLVSGSSTVCPNTPVNLNLNFQGDPPYEFVYAVNGAPQPAITTNLSNYVLTVNPPSGTAIYSLVSMQGAGCAGTVSGTYTVTTTPVPTTTLMGNATICAPGNSALLTFTNSGTPPFQIQYTANGVPQPPIQTSLTNFVLTVNPTVTTTYQITAVTGGNNCTGSFSGTATVTLNTPLTGVISGGGQICQGGSGTTLTFTFTGAGPYDFVYSVNNVPQPPIQTSQNPYVLNVNPLSGSLYQLVSLQNNFCTGTVSGQAYVFVFTPPTAELQTLPSPVCPPAPLHLTVDFTGTGPFSIVYTTTRNNITTFDTLTSISDDPLLIPITVTQNTTYSLVWVQSPGCVGLPSGTTSVSVAAAPTFSNLSVQCNQAAGTYILGFDVQGTAPFQLISGGGTFHANQHFTSNPIPLTQPFHIQFTDAAGCDTITVAGIPNCNCTTAAGNIETSPVDLCLDATVGITHLGGQHLDADDALRFILHTNALNPPGQILAWSNTPAFSFIPGKTLVGNTYFVSAIAGNAVGNDSISLTDPCLDISSSKPVVWHDMPIATFPADFSVCSGDSARFNLLLSGSPPFNFAYQMGGATPIAVNGWTQLTYPIAFLPTGNTRVRVISLEDRYCSDGVTTDEINISLVPPIQIINLTVNCNVATQTYTLQFQVEGGTPPYLVNGLSGSFTGNVFNSNALPLLSPYIFTVSTSCGATVVSGTPNCSCPPPTVSGISQICDFVNQTYQVVCQISGGTPPFVFSGIAGNLSGNTFTSIPIPFSQTYNFQLWDANRCDTLQFVGISTCSCNTFAGSMGQTTINTCVADSARATFLGGHTLDVNDRLLYILHDQPAIPWGQILAWNTQPVFGFIAGSMFPGNTYYISAIAGNAAAGLIDLTDPCLSIAPGQPVVWRNRPTAFLPQQTFHVCRGESQNITVYMTGQPPFHLTYQINNNTPVTALSLSNTFNLNITVVENATLSLTGVRDNTGCTGTANGSIQIEVHTVPKIENVVVNCAPDAQSYTVEFDVKNAYLPSVVISGSLGGNFNTVTGHFISGAVPVAHPYNAIVSDLWQCGVDSIRGTVNCNCTTFAGTMRMDTFTFCSNVFATVPAATNVQLDGNDTLIYVLATEQSPPVWTILGVNRIPSFSFNAGLTTPNQIYYIIPVAGNKGAQGIDFSDPCRSIGIGTPIRWTPPVTAFLSGNVEICQGDTANLTVQLTGNPPFQFSFMENGLPQGTRTSNSSTYQLRVSPPLSANYSLITVSDNACIGTVSGGAAVSVLLPPNLIDVQQNCDFVQQTYTISFKITNGQAPNPTYSVSGIAGTLNDTLFTSVPIPFSQPFHVVISNPTGCTATLSGSHTCSCVTDAGNLVSGQTVEACATQLLFVQHAGNYKLDGNDALQYILFENPVNPLASILNRSSVPQFLLQSGMQVGQVYYVAAIAGNALAGVVDLSDPCLSVSPPVQVRWIAGPAAVIGSQQEICPGQSALVPVTFSGTGPFTFVYALNGQTQPPIQSVQSQYFIVSNNIIQNQTFSLVSVSNNMCPGTVSGVATVMLKPVPMASLLGGSTTCPGITTPLIINLAGGDLFDVVISGGVNPIQLTGISNGHVLQVSPMQTTTYTIQSVSSNLTNCPANIGSSAKVTIEPLQSKVKVKLKNGFGVTCNGIADGQAVAEASGGTPPYLFEWSGNQQQETLLNVPAGKYTVIITDAKGCTTRDSVEITEPPAINFTWSVQAPQCADKKNGYIAINSLTGGTPPFVASLNGGGNRWVNTKPYFITDLGSGLYQVILEDANGCLVQQDVYVPDVEPLIVSLGDDITLPFGDSTMLVGSVSASAIASFTWTPTEFLRQPNALRTMVKPYRSMVYKLTVKDTAGCTATDEVTIYVEKRRRVFVPNVIRTGEGTVNEFFTIFGGPELVSIPHLHIYDRWGEKVFETRDLKPGDIPRGWEGYSRGQWLMPGVYVYVATLEYIDGSTEEISGDISIIR